MNRQFGSAPLFHFAFAVDDLEAARTFYRDGLGCREGRCSAQWIDFDFGGHQIVAHLVPTTPKTAAPLTGRNVVDGHDVPVPHFGLILEPLAFHTLADRLRAMGIVFVIEPYCRFAGEAGEQWTMFVNDPSGNTLEFKAFADRRAVFAQKLSLP
ncbi:MAG: VOC family protein [Planctomycetota bacterium]